MERRSLGRAFRHIRSAFGLFLGAIALGSLMMNVGGCKSGAAYSDEEVKRMNAEAAAIKDPSKLPPEVAKARAEAVSKMRANLPVPPPPPRQAR